MGIPRRSRPTQAGFTLVELVLVVTLMLLLAGAAVLNFGSFQRGAQLDEGVGQLEYLFRLARASASSSGRLVRVTFGGESQPAGTNAPGAADGIQVTCEPDPLQAPGAFRPLAEAVPLVERLNGLIQIHPVPGQETGFGMMSPDSATNAPPGMVMEAMASTNVPAIRFYPDGSSDTADFLVASLDSEDTRQVRIRLSGLVGTVRRQWLSPGTEPGDPAATMGPESTPAMSASSPAGPEGTSRSP